jgi:hypothetical protein
MYSVDIVIVNSRRTLSHYNFHHLFHKHVLEQEQLVFEERHETDKIDIKKQRSLKKILIYLVQVI